MRSTSPPKSAWPGIDDVDARILPEDGRHLGQDGDAALPFEIIGIEGALGNALVFAQRSRLLEQPIDQGRLPVVDMSDDCNIAQIYGGMKTNAGHKGPLSPGI